MLQEGWLPGFIHRLHWTQVRFCFARDFISAVDNGGAVVLETLEQQACLQLLFLKFWSSKVWSVVMRHCSRHSLKRVMAVHLSLVCTGAIPAQLQLSEHDAVLTDMACWLMGSEFTSTAGIPV